MARVQRSPRGRRGPGYPIRPGWQTSVKARLAELGLTEKDLAKLVGCAQSTIHATLNSPEAKHSSLVPDIHRVLKWRPPADPDGDPPVVFSLDALELAAMYDRLPPEIRKALHDQTLAMIRALRISIS